jgi:Ca2+-binding RTX toxin-like protein
MTKFSTVFSDAIDVSGLTGSLWNSSVTALDNGRTAVSWTERGNEAVWIRLYGPNGVPEGSAVEVTGVDEKGNRPSLAALENGTFIVTYTSLPSGVGSAIYARMFASDGTPLGTSKQLFSANDGLSVSPKTAGLSNSDSISIFTATDENRFGVFAQLADSNGAAKGDAWSVNQTTEGFQSSGVPVLLDDGGFVVTWRSRDVDGSFYAVMMRSYDADGTPRSGEVRVNQYSFDSQQGSDVTVLLDGRFVISWQSAGQDGSGDAVYARIYSAEGIAEGNEFSVNTTTFYDQKNASIAALPDGGFVVAWMNEPTSASSITDIRFQKFDSQGGKVGDETVLAESPTGVHAAPDIAIGEDGIARIVWTYTIQSSFVSTVFLKTVNLMIIATPEDDSLIGTASADYLLGLGGNDIIDGGDGPDILLGDDFELRYGLNEANQVFRLYQATFNRAPDETGHKRWASDLLTGESTLADVREGFVGSKEFRNKYDSLDNATFVKQMYINVLDRDFDQGEVTQAEINNWTGRITDSFTRADVVNGFAESQQLINTTLQDANALAVNGNPASWSDDVYRLYQATFDRAPDLAGFEGWSERLADGRSLTEVISGFTNSQEFANTYGTLTDPEDFVKLLYNNVLDRDFDAGEVAQSEIAGWTSQLSETFTRANIVQGFSQSREFTNNTAQELKDWVKAQGVDDQIDGGAGTNVLAGGAMSDQFVFSQADSATNTVIDLEAWDYLSFDGFGYSSVAEARGHMVQSSGSVVFSDQGTEVTFERFQLSNITDDMILV